MTGSFLYDRLCGSVSGKIMSGLGGGKWGEGCILVGAHPEMASFGPGRRSRSFAILDVALLRLRLQTRCGLGLNQNPPFLDGHQVVPDEQCQLP
jgi:hypothetical protein